MSSDKEFPPRVWLPINSLRDKLEKEFDVFMEYKGDTQFLSLDEHNSKIYELKLENEMLRAALNKIAINHMDYEDLHAACKPFMKIARDVLAKTEG